MARLAEVCTGHKSTFGQLNETKNSCLDLYIIGDFNVDLLKAHKYNYTNNSLDITLAHQVLPVITQPTRFSSTSATLITNMFTNCMHTILDSSIMVEYISDHLPILVRIDILQNLVLSLELV